jgi:dienelactone hydrolase
MTHSTYAEWTELLEPATADPAIRIRLDGVHLDADLTIPRRATAIVLFAHGTGIGRKCPRNRLVAEQLQRAGLATLLLDLLTPDEERADAHTGVHRFDIPLLAARFGEVTDLVGRRPETRYMRVGYFGASTGAAAALVAAAERPGAVSAVVSGDGRPDLAHPFLEHVTAPTLLVVGGDDVHVLDLNREALHALGGPKRLEVVPGAAHPFEEPAALEIVARLARDWFERYLAPSPRVAAMGGW